MEWKRIGDRKVVPLGEEDAIDLHYIVFIIQYNSMKIRISKKLDVNLWIWQFLKFYTILFNIYTKKEEDYQKV